MDRMKDHIKILSTLSLASSDTREDTLASVIIRTIEYSKSGLKKELLSKKIRENFEFEPYKSELENILKKLIKDDQVTSKDGILTLSTEKAKIVYSNDLSLTDNDKKRFQNFKAFIQDDLESKIDVADIKLLWQHFLNYLYNCFFEYGQEALKTLHPHISFDNDKDFESISINSINKLKSERSDLNDIFEKVIEFFPSYASEEDLEFLVQLAQKTSSFSSLGINPSLLSGGLENDLIDWTLYLDTNVLYSLLDLHSHPETEACKALIELIHDNHEIIKIKLRYSEFTYKELKNKRQDFDLLDAKMSNPAIVALLKSGKIDGFAEQFYKTLLEKPDTLHPSEVVELSQIELKASNIKIGRNAKRVENIGEDYINAQISDYFKHIETRNSFKEEFSKKYGSKYHPITKSEAQVRHDIILREILRDSRKIKEGSKLTMNNIKFFGLTLDSMLISFDRSKTKDYHNEDTYPIFFKPSFLLDKLTRILPVQTKNYKKAFVKAITTKGFHQNGKKSRDILRLVNYLKSKGIDNTDVIYNMISEDLFLDKLNGSNQSQDFNQDDFISSEINRQFEQAQKRLNEVNTDLEDTTAKNQLTEDQNKQLQKKQEEASMLVDQYQRALRSLNTKISKAESQKFYLTQHTLDFDSAEEKQKIKEENESLKSQLKSQLRSQVEEEIEDYKDKQLKKWQKKVWWNLFWVIPVMITVLLILIPNDLFHIQETENNNRQIDIVINISGALLTLFFFYILWYRYFNEIAISKKRESVRIPKELKNKLSDSV